MGRVLAKLSTKELASDANEDLDGKRLSPVLAYSVRVVWNDSIN